jgi:hypothetical protein
MGTLYLFRTPMIRVRVAWRRKQNVQLQEQGTCTTIDDFNDAFDRHNFNGSAALLTDDTMFENTSPARVKERTKAETNQASTHAAARLRKGVLLAAKSQRSYRKVAFRGPRGPHSENTPYQDQSASA